MEWVKLGDVVDIRTGKLNANAANENGIYPFFTTSDETLRIDSFSYDEEAVLVAGNGNLNVKYYKGKFDAYQRTYILTDKYTVNLNMKYIFFFLDSYLDRLRFQSIGGVIKYIKLENLIDANLILPDLNIQNFIVKILEASKTLISTRKAQITALDELVQSLFYEMFGDVRINEKKFQLKYWKEVLKINNGKNQKKVENIDGEYPIYGSGGIMAYADNWITKENSVVIGRKGNINTPLLVKEKFWHVDTAFGLEPEESILNVNYLYGFCKEFNFETLNKAVTIPSLTKKDLLEIQIPLPPLELQEQFAAKVEAIESQKAKLQASLEEMEILFDALMQEAFSGNLG